MTHDPVRPAERSQFEEAMRRADVKPGDRVRITGVMSTDPDPLPVGTEGTVREVHENVGQIYVDWDEDAEGTKRWLILLTHDPFEVVG